MPKNRVLFHQGRSMSSDISISPEKLSPPVGTVNAPGSSEGSPRNLRRYGRQRVFAFVLLTVAAVSQLATPVEAGAASDNKTIVFVCLHGSVKSQMAAALFNKVAKERGLPYTAISRGIQVDASIPATIRDGLSLDGLAPADDVPRALTATEADSAVKVVAFDPVPDDNRGAAEVNYWSGVPPAMKDYVAARDVIAHRIDDLLPVLATRTRPQETLRGTITAVDERNDMISIRLAPDSAADLRVQDGLVFNSVRDGDQVEVTVESIDGVKTIVGLTKQ
jgi:Low molecular weight phosphotyrosine protein phosphatase